MGPHETELTEQEAPRGTRTTSFRISVTSGADQGKQAWVHSSSPGAIRIGSSSVCELSITDRKVSRRHASLEWADGQLRIADLQSTNGTLVDGVRIEGALLHGGETVRLGDTSFSVEAVGGAPAPTAPTVESFGRVLGASLAMRRIYPVFERLAAADIPVIIEGETGTGKELLAEALHEQGPRKHGPFIVFEVASGDTKALEQALFGFEDRSGRNVVVQTGAFEEAQGGTLLIDDVAELPLVLQAKLLRAVERKEICRVGGTTWRSIDARLLVATRRDLDREVESGNFREDLFYRLAVGRVELPPLRRREGDVPLLAAHFWRRMDRAEGAPPADLIPTDAYHWPGNVRELHNMIARRLALGDAFGEMPPGPSPSSAVTIFERVVNDDLSFSEARARVIAEFERFFVSRTLERHGGNVTKAAAAAGIARRYFRRLKARHR